MRKLLVIGALAGLTLSGCARPVPDSSAGAGQGVGFGDYSAYELERARREAQLTGAAPGTYVVPVAAPVAPVPAAAPPSGISSGELAAVGIGAAPPPVTSGPLGGVPAAIAGATPVPGALPPPTTVAPTPPPVLSPGTVPGTVPGDASPTAGAAPPVTVPGDAGGTVSASSAGAAIYGEGRLGAAQIAPGALPANSDARPEWSPQADPLRDHGLEAQPGNAAPVLVNAPAVAPVADAGPNIVEYALAAPNQKGQEWYSRFAFSGQGRMQRNCGDYRSADEAQRDFLSRGGPGRDPRGLDPDGDGFACGWDPAPFRAAVGG